MQKRQETDALHNPIVAYSIILSTHLKLQIFIEKIKRGQPNYYPLYLISICLLPVR